MHKTLCVISKCGISEVRPPTLQSQTLWGILLLLPDPQAGEPDGGVQNFQSYGRTSVILQFVAHVRFDFTVIVPLLLACCGFFFVFRCRTFLVGSSNFVVVNGGFWN